MEKQKSSVRYAPEVRERAVRMVLEHAGNRGSQWEAIASIAAKIGCSGETLRKWVRQAERDRGLRAGPTSAEQARIKALGKAVKTTIGNPAAPCPRDKVNRQFQAARPNALWVADFTYVASWQGFVYVAFVIDVFARRIPRVGLCPPEDRLWLAGLAISRDRLCLGCPGTGALSPAPLPSRLGAP